MTNQQQEKLNDFFVGVFNQILAWEGQTIDLIIENIKDILIRGTRKDISIFSIREINIIIEALPSAAVVSFPSNIFITVIIRRI